MLPIGNINFGFFVHYFENIICACNIKPNFRPYLTVQIMIFQFFCSANIFEKGLSWQNVESLLSK